MIPEAQIFIKFKQMAEKDHFGDMEILNHELILMRNCT